MEHLLSFVQCCQLEMVIQVKKICEKYHIKFFLDAGTLLGAVREKGFIPWDDDIDIGFERKDYNRFLEIAEKELPATLYLQRWDSEFAYGYPYAKLRYLGTKYKLNTDYQTNATDGVFLDLLPYDYVPNNAIFRHIHSFRLRFIYLMIQFRLGYYPVVKHKSLLPFIKMLSNTIQVEKQKKRYERIVIKYNNKSGYQMVTEADGIDYYRFIIPRTIIQHVTKLLFEGIEFPVPRDYDKYLTIVYGDYMKRPKMQDQVGKHGVLPNNGKIQ